MNKLAIIDDEKELGEVLKLLILTCGDFDVENFSCVEDFLERRKSKNFNIVFSDLNLPGMSGLECADLLLSNNKSERFVLMSGGSFEDLDKKNHPIDYYLYKPFNLKSLRQCLAN